MSDAIEMELSNLLKAICLDNCICFKFNQKHGFSNNGLGKQNAAPLF